MWLVDLAALTDPTLIPQALASTLGLRQAPRSERTAAKPTEGSRGSEAGALAEDSVRGLTEALAAYVRSRSLLLVLDNCEHLSGACAALARQLLGAASDLRILATSRQALHVTGEAVWRVRPLALPGPTPTLEEAASSEAVQLFVDRARLIQPGFTLDRRHVADIAQICRRLDGIPLAIELAAARVGALALDQLASRLDDRLRVLMADEATPARHRTPRAAALWSYDLLSPPERTLFNRLAVLVGGWTLDAAEIVGGRQWAVGNARGRDSTTPLLGDEGSHPSRGEPLARPLTDHSPADDSSAGLLNCLASLVDKSLVMAEAGLDGSIRYRMLETLRELGLERLVGSGEAEAARRQHAEYFLALAEQSEAELKGPRQAQWAESLEQDHDNLRAALGWTVERRETEMALRLSGALWLFWEVRGHVGEGQRWLDRCLALGGEGDSVSAALAWAKARALNAAGNLARVRDELRRSIAYHEASLAIRWQLGDTGGIAVSLHNLGRATRDLGDSLGARLRLEESLALSRENGDAGTAGLTLLELAQLAEAEGDNAEALARYEESLTLFHEVGNARGVATVLNRLGALARARGELVLARTLHEQSLTLHRERGDSRGIGITLNYLARLSQVASDEGGAESLTAESLRTLRDLGVTDDIISALGLMAEIACTDGRFSQAARLLGAVAWLSETSESRRPSDRARFEQAVDAARTALGEDAFRAAWTLGRLMTLEQAVDEALGRAELPG